MKEFFLKIFDWLSARRWLAWTLLAVLLALAGFSITRMGYSEDISAFLPGDETADKYREVYSKLGAQSRVAVIFDVEEGIEAEPEDLLLDAMDEFADEWPSALSFDDSSILDVFDFISSNWPYFALPEDYERADSLLADPGYIQAKIASDKSSLNLISSAVTSRYMRTDPLGLFAPVLARMKELNPTDGSNVVDGHLFTSDGSTGVVFFDSPYGESESGRNGAMLDSLRTVTAAVEASNPGVRITLTGGPVVAVENASRIKKDSILAVSLALVLICLVLFFSYRRLSDVVWIAVSILCGALFSLGLIALFKSTISIIILGIGAMILGIAVNYPLHYIDHLKYEPDRREALKEQITPLLVGNITTVGAFLSLLMLKAEALRDFGLVGALMLVGTIIFVLVFLPVLSPGRTEIATDTVKLDFDRHIKLGSKARLAVFAAFIVLTAVFAFFSLRISFDSDMHNINYMTPEESRGFEVLAAMGSSKDNARTVYAVAQGADSEEALERAEEMGGFAISGFLPSRKAQAERLEAWNAFLAAHPSLRSDIAAAASREGFSATAFDPFCSVLETDFEPEAIEFFEPVTSTLGKSMFFDDGDKVSVVGYMSEKPARNVEGCFSFTDEDVSSKLVGLLSEDFDFVGLVCSLIVFFFLWLSFGRLELSILSFLPLAVGWIWILGMMQIFGLKFNIVNIILATFIFGMGDDYTIFITEGLMYEYASGKKILHSFKNSVALSALIMFIGIGALIVAKHPAMRSLAEVTIIGMLTVVVMAYYLPPLVFRYLTEKKGRVREVPVTIGRILRSVYAFSAFFIVILVATPIVFVSYLFGGKSEEKKLRLHKFLQKISRFFLNNVPGAPFSWTNPTGEDFSRPAVYVCNHQSHFDVLAALMLTPKMVILTNDWVWNNIFYGALIHRAEFYPASDGMETNMPRFKDLVSRGYSILVFPEGTRSEDCSIGRFHRGAFTIARETGVDVVPLFIHGFGYALPKKDFMLRKAGMSLEVGRRVSNADLLEIGDDKAVARYFHKLYIDEYSRIRREKETASSLAPFVRYQYLYKGADVMKECRKVLVEDTFREIDEWKGSGEIVIRGSGYGVYALLFALAHPEADVTAVEEDEEKRAVAAHCRAVPSNLKYKESE